MKLQTLTVAAAIALSAALPSFAQETDPAKMTCKDYMAMDAEGMKKAMTDMKTAAMADTMADPAKMNMSDEDMMKMMSAACDGKPDVKMMDMMRTGG